MSDGTATEPVDFVEHVVRTHMAPVTGLEEEVALILSGLAGSTTADSDDREPG
jgi:hypothetical protein